MGDATGRVSAALMRHDRMIVANQLRLAFYSWKDRLIALAMLLIALLAARSSLTALPFIVAATAVAAFAAAAGAWTALIIGRRLDFHAQDGVLAADALTVDVRRHYLLSIHALLCVVVSICAAVARPQAALLAPISYLFGAGVCHVAGRIVLANSVPRRPSPLRAMRGLVQRPVSGVLAAVLVLLPLSFVESIDRGPMAVFAGLLSTVAALLLTMLDYGAVRFMTESGYGAWRIVGVHARSLLAFLVLVAPSSLALSHSAIAIVVVGVVAAALVLMTARILAYRVHSKLTADMLLGICAAVAFLVGVAIPILLPVVVIAILWHLHRRSNSATWLLT